MQNIGQSCLSVRADETRNYCRGFEGEGVDSFQKLHEGKVGREGGRESEPNFTRVEAQKGRDVEGFVGS